MDLRVNLQSGAAPDAGEPSLLPLAPGRVLTARVVGVQDGQVLLDLAGEIQPARSLVPLTVGDALRVQVLRASGREVWLRVLHDAGGALAGDRLAEALRGQGIPPGEEALVAARGLIAAGEPVTPTRVCAVMATLRHDTGASATPAQTALAASLLLGRALPPLPPLLAALRYYGQGAPPFAALAVALDRALAALPEEPPGRRAGAGPQSGKAGPLPGWVGALRGLLKDLTLPAAPLPGPEALAARLGEAFRALGMDWEREWVIRWTRPEGEKGAPTLPAAPSPGPAPGPPSPPPTLKGLLLAVHDALRAAVAEPEQGEAEGRPAPGVYRQALARTEEALQTITAWQVLSAEPEEAGASARRTVVFQLPVAFGAVVGTLDVAVEMPARRKGGSGEDGSPAGGGAGGDGREAGWHAVRLRLAPPHLGEVCVDLFLQDRRLNVGFGAREEPSRVVLEEGGQALAERLRRQGFRVEGIRFGSLPDEGAGDPWAVPQRAGIDLIL